MFPSLFVRILFVTFPQPPFTWLLSPDILALVLFSIAAVIKTAGITFEPTAWLCDSL